MIKTVTPGFSWSGSGGVGSVEYRTASEVVNTAPLGALRMVTIIVSPSRVRVAVVPEESIETVALVCIRH